MLRFLMACMIANWVFSGDTLLHGADAAYDPLVVKEAAAPIDLDVQDETRNRKIPIRVYLPKKAAATSSEHVEVPVILFSHGLGGSREVSPFLGKHWAGRGYAAVFLQHPGSDTSVWRDALPRERMAAMQKAANAENFALRAKDVPAVLNQLEKWTAEKDHRFHQQFDLKHVGMSGHSFGAVTTQAVSGQTFPLIGQPHLDRRIQAAVIMSPSSPRVGDVKESFHAVKLPWLLMTGTKDTSPIGNQDVKSRLAVFPALPEGSKYELVLNEAEHSIFTERALPGEMRERNPNHQKAILAISTAFWDAYLLQDAAAKKWLDGTGAEGVLEKADRWQKK